MRNIVAHDYANADLKIIWDGPPRGRDLRGVEEVLRPPPMIDSLTPAPHKTGAFNQPHKNNLFLFQSTLGFIAATRSFEPDPHRETDLSASVNGTSRGCTRSGVRI
jgi:hypothetical protein